MLPVTSEHLAALQQAYSTPPRAYHSFAHVEEMRAHFESVKTWQRPNEVFVAVLYHDIIYVAGRADNEQLSAETAKHACATYWPDQALDVPWVEKLILLTAGHGKNNRNELTEDERLFLDCDMAILAAPWERFQRYDEQIAEEYVRVPRLLYRNGRKRFLKRLLKSDRIYLSEFFHEKLEHLARDNVQRLLDG